MESLVLEIGLFVCLFGFCCGDTTVSMCKNGKDGDWRSELSHFLLGVPFAVEPVPCEGIGREEKAVSLRHTSSGLIEIVRQVEGQTQDQFFAVILSKISSSRITSVEDNLEETLNGVKESVVAYVEPNTKNHVAFQQAVLSTALPHDVKVFQVTNKALLPQKNLKQVKKNLHVWVVTDGEWSHLKLPYRGLGPNEMMHYIVGVFSKLQFPLKVTYKSPDSYTEYKEARFNIFVVYCHSDQIYEVEKTLINPLVNIFRPYFVFITFNVDEHRVPRDVSAEGPFPYIVTHKEGQKSGVHINSEYTPYTVENIKSILESMIDPLVNNVEAPPPHSSITVTRTDIMTLEAITRHDHIPALAALCLTGSPDCDLMEDRLNKAARAVWRVGERYDIMLFIVECENVGVVSLVKVPQLPYVIAKGEDGQWSLYSDNTVVAKFVEGIQTFGRRKADSDVEDYSASADSTSEIEHENYYDTFQELMEDDMFGIMFSDYLVVPPSLPVLTTDIYTSFMDQNGNCLIAFYLPYCLSCKPMLYLLMNTTEQMKSAGMPTAIVNCAEYPDVCEVFDVYQYPTVKYRRGSTGDWTTYKGVLSNTELVKLALDRQEEQEEEQEKRIVELTPSLLIKMLKSDRLSSILMLSAEEVTPELDSTLSGVMDYQIYWLNSTRYSKLSDFLIGLSVSPPVLVLADYMKLSLYRLDLKIPTPQERVTSFINDAISGAKSPDAEITPSDWAPSSPPIMFPSAHFLVKEQYKEAQQEEEGAEYYDEQPPDEGYKPYRRENEESGYAGGPVEHGRIHQHEEL